jgi:hypothetical protein
VGALAGREICWQFLAMKIKTAFRRLTAALALAASVWAAGPAGGEEINFQNVPLDVAIANLARQAGHNFILDPQLSAPFDASGKVIQQPAVTFQVTDTTAELALGKILKEHGLVLIADPVTTVARITFTNQPAKKVEASVLAGDTNAPVPLIVFADVPMDVAIKNLAGSAQLDVVLDAKISDGYRTADGKLITLPTVSLRWQNITARQALLAMCLNYDLTITAEAKPGVLKIGLKEQPFKK